MGAHVLVVDDDPQILRMLTEVLTKRGFGVDIARDGEEAFGRALEHPPDLLVTDVMMPKLDGWSLVRKLRLDPKLANLPVIFLTAVATDDARVQAFRLGADDYVNKPFKFNDLVARIEKVLRAKSPTAIQQQASSGLAGDLAQIGLSTLLVLVEMERKTGILSVNAADGRSGKMSTRDGKIIDASLEGKNQPIGAEAVYVMLTWTAGKFEFAVRTVEGEDKIKQSTTHLLIEGARLMDEAKAPEAVAQLDEEAIAEWGVDEPTPMIAAAKIADLVRRSARNSAPPYAGHVLTATELAAIATAPTSGNGKGPAAALAKSVTGAAAPAATTATTAAGSTVTTSETATTATPPTATPPAMRPSKIEDAPPARLPKSSGAPPPRLSGPDIAAALAAAAEAGIDAHGEDDDQPAAAPTPVAPLGSGATPSREGPAMTAPIAAAVPTNPTVAAPAPTKPTVAEARPSAAVSAEPKQAVRAREAERPDDKAERADDKPLRSSVQRRRASPLWLIGCVLFSAGGAATFAIQPTAVDSPSTTTELRADATAFGAALDRSVDSAQMRADGLAAMPMLRSGIETDAATLQDLVANEMMLKPASNGEVIELFQLRDTAPVSVLRLPPDGRPVTMPTLELHLRVGADGTSIEAIATSPIRNARGADAGSVGVSLPVDLKTVGSIASHAHGAKITGLEKPVEVVPVSDAAASVTVTVPVSTKAASGLALVANVRALAKTNPPAWLDAARLGTFALAGLMLLLYIVASARAGSTRNA